MCVLKTHRKIKKAQKPLDTRKKMNLVVGYWKSLEAHYFFLLISLIFIVFAFESRSFGLNLCHSLFFLHLASLTSQCK